MNRYSCLNEPNVLAALRSGAWEIGLRDHVKDCPLCADVLVVAGFLQQEAHLAKPAAILPTPGFLWWKSQLLGRQATVNQATRPIAFVRILAFLICGAAVLWFLFASAQTQEWVAGALGNGIHLQAMWTGDLRPIVLLSLGGTFLSTLLASFYMAWIER